jgi:succinate dehydrogenase / fumarate reductase cytochrome b subunit
MIWTGLALAAFVVWHILTLRNGIHYYYINPEVMGGVVVLDMWLTTVEVLGNPLFALFYITVMLLLGFHLWHAISSAFQTMGINHQKWTPIIDKLCLAYCVVVACGFGVTAAGSFAIMNVNEKAKAIYKQSKNPEYQKALETLSKKPIEEQKMLAKAISKNPEKAKFIMERDVLIRDGGADRGFKKRFDGERRLKRGGPPGAPRLERSRHGEQEDVEIIQEEGGEQ